MHNGGRPQRRASLTSIGSQTPTLGMTLHQVVFEGPKKRKRDIRRRRNVLYNAARSGSRSVINSPRDDETMQLRSVINGPRDDFSIRSGISALTLTKHLRELSGKIETTEKDEDDRSDGN